MCRWWVFSKCCCLCLAYLKCILFWQFAYALPLLHFKLIIPKTHSDKIWTLLCSGSGVSSCEMHQHCFNKIYNVNSNVFGRRQKKKKKRVPNDLRKSQQLLKWSQFMHVCKRSLSIGLSALLGILIKKKRKKAALESVQYARWAYVG